MPATLRKAKSIKNCLVPINRIPPETLALIGAFLAKERDLINATAVCRRWRTIFLSSPRLWCYPGGSSSELEAYLERSKSAPIKVDLSSPRLVVSIIPHTSRLVALNICVSGLSDFNLITKCLHYPIPTLHTLGIFAKNRYLHILVLPSGLREGLFLHLKRLSLSENLSFHGSQTFLHITELSLHTHADYLHQQSTSDRLLSTLEQLPGLEKVSAVFLSGWHAENFSANVVTLPCVKEMHLSAAASESTTSARSVAIPPILRYLKLPKATSLSVESIFPLVSNPSILPVTSFCEHLPNYVELSELRIDITAASGYVVFRSPSQTVFTYQTGELHDFGLERRLWGSLPLSSVRRVTVVLADPAYGGEDRWLVDLLAELDFLEHLELRGDCGQALRRFRHRMVRGVMRIDIKTLIVRGGEYAKSQAFKFENVKGNLGMQDTTVTYILDPEAWEGFGRDPDVESSGDDEVLGEDSDSDSDDEDGEDDEGSDSDLYDEDMYDEDPYSVDAYDL